MEIKTLGELCNIVSGGTPLRSKPEYWNNGTIPWIKIGDMKGKYINNADECITQAGLDSSSAKMLPKGTILYTIFATLGDVGILEINASTNQAIAGLTIKDNSQILSEYLYYYLKSKKGYVKTIGRGVAQSNINMSILKSFQVPLPTSLKQKEIVDILDKITNIIKYRQQELHMLDNLIKARFIELFGDPLIEDDRYPRVPLGSLAEVGSSKRIFEKEYVSEGIPFYRTKEIVELSKGNRITTELFITKERYDEIRSEYGVPQKGDLLISAVGTIGVIWIVDGKNDFYFKDGNLLRVSATEKFVPEYLKHLLEALISAYKSEMSSGTAYAALTISALKEMMVYDVPHAEQEQFAAFVKQIDKSKSHAPHLPIPPLKWYPLSKNEVPIMEEKIIAITNEMAEVLNIAQLKKLQEVLVKAFSAEEPERKPTNHEYLRLFLEAKSIEGCSPRTLQYYEVTVQHLFAAVNLPVRKMTTERMREYLSDYQQRRNCSKATIDNIRRNISSFFSWLEEEDHILKSPMRRIHKIKTKKTVKEVISDEDIEKLRDSCTSLRDLAMIDLLYSTGIRVGELVRLNIEDVNFESRECVVFGKGDKERRVYFDAKTKIHLKNYLESRRDTNRALFVSLLAPYNRLAISGVEIRLRKMGRMLNLKSIHPHKFRRTMATRAIDKGMPIEQVQKILGHSQIDTTMQYAIVNQNNVKMSHQKYIA